MRYFRISAHEIFEVPDTASIVDHPVEGGLCVQADGSYWEPAIIWMRFVEDATPLLADSPKGSGLWIQDDDGPSGFMVISEGSDLRVVSERKARELKNEG